MAAADIGVIGLAVMGRNLVLNLADHGYTVAVFNRTTSRVDELLRDEPDKGLIGCHDLAAFVAALKSPRVCLLMVQAGAAVDAQIELLLQLLAPGDIVIDGGNSLWEDSNRRTARLSALGFHYIGMGVSGGEEGARHGPALMPAGDARAWPRVRPMFQAIAAQVDGAPCCEWIGDGGAGHYVKMVHNGIEYGDMQLIAECYDLMQHVLGMSTQQMADAFAAWNKTFLESFLIEITARILRTTDPATKQPMVDVIVDRAGQKGTGKWTTEMALRYGVPAPTMHAAVEARCLSAMKEQRVAASTQLRGPAVAAATSAGLLDAVRDALYCSKVCSYAQGLDLLATADADKKWGLDLGEIARIWKGGCIIRARFLGRIQAAYGKQKRLPNLLLDPELGGFLVEHQGNWRKVVALAAERGVPTLAMGSSLSYFDSFRRARLPQNLTQAQRDLFGAHTFERTDKPAGEMFHHEWP
ncbi:MAG: NADP-dependent phosphogluconate dehydrogenase [Planctomycetota bacterium]